MPEPLVCEDTSLSRLMETVTQTPGARILYQDTVRRGGVLGFFAREVHRVAYLVGDAETAELAQAGDLDGSPIADLLASAEAAEARLHGDVEAPADGTLAQPDFASVLRHYAEAGLPVEPAADDAAPLAAVTPLGPRGGEARNRLELLMQLRQIGVPVSLNPTSRVSSPYEALEDILEQLPAPADLPGGAGQLIVIVGDGASALRAARTASRMLRLKVGSIVTAGVDSSIGRAVHRISGPDEAALLREELAAAPAPSIVAIGTDGAGLGPDDPWPAAMVEALRPTAVWAVVDARWKTEDSQAQLAKLPRVDALVVHSAELSGSPASVWELELPIALLDDRRPSNYIWLGMLTRLFGGPARHRASA